MCYCYYGNFGDRPINKNKQGVDKCLGIPPTFLSDISITHEVLYKSLMMLYTSLNNIQIMRLYYHINQENITYY